MAQHFSARWTLAGFAILVLMVLAALLWRGPGGRDLQRILADNGFIELRPPSTLIRPGTWVEVQARNPLRLKTICSAETALNLSREQLAQSTSADTSVTRAFTGSFNLGLDALGIGELGAKSKTIEGVELRLSNIRLIELADDQILKNLPKRDKACADAIKLRYKENPQSLTMIDTVLFADAEYHLTFNGQADANAKSAAVQELAAKANLFVDLNRKDSAVILGQNLVWGVKDNRLMALQGIVLPNVGAEPGANRSILRDSGPIEAIDTSRQARRNFDGMAVQVRLDVPVLKQPTPMSCWAAVFAMLVSWKTGSPVPIASAVATLGAPYTTYLAEDRGLPGGEEPAFVKAAGLRAVPPADYELSVFRDILRGRGPAWIITGDGMTSHARLLVGIYSPDEEERRATYEATIMEFIDPATGTYFYEPALSFFETYEREAGFVVHNHLDDIDLRWQIISY
jgi:Papain-like cysteine protease AvrRpt2